MKDISFSGKFTKNINERVVQEEIRKQDGISLVFSKFYGKCGEKTNFRQPKVSMLKTAIDTVMS